MFKNCCWSCSCSFPELQAAEHLIKAVFRIEREFQRFCNLYSSFVLNIIKEIYQIRQFLFVYPWLASALASFQNCFLLFLFSFCSSIYKFGLSGCLSVRLYPINVKMVEPIGPKFVVGPWSQGRFIDG